MICITPRAFALETAALLKPLSCQAIALASEAGTPSRTATWPICDAVTRPGVAFGVAAGTIRLAGAGAGAPAAAADSVPLGSFSTVPARSIRAGSTPFIHASCRMDTPARAAIPPRVSPGRTTYDPAGGGADATEDAAPAVPSSAAGSPLEMPAPRSEIAASVTVGIWIVLPSTTFE